MTDGQPGRLGFGTANLAGRVTRKESLRLLDVAWDAGIRHFDTAPMYGYGAAEGLLAEFIRFKSEPATIATKFGIEPPRRSALMSAAKAAARVVVSVVPAVRSKLAARAASMVSAGNFDVPYATMSLQRSLASFGMNRIDMLLMHEPNADQITPELIAFLTAARDAGEIATFGLAGTASETPVILQSGKTYGNVVMLPEAAFARAKAVAPALTTFITHSIFSATFKTFASKLDADPAIVRRCSDALGIDCTDRKKLGRLFLWGALLRNSGGIVVFSSLTTASIQHNAALLREPEFTAAQATALDRLLADLT